MEVTEADADTCFDNDYDRKVAIVLEELGLTYESVYLDFQKGEQKGPEHVKHNPNGRIPTLIDHKNGDFVIWYASASRRHSRPCILIGAI